jgi:hypothetical protein
MTAKKNDLPADLGDEVKDVVSGYRGIVTGVFKYLNGCVRLCLSSRKLVDGKVPDDFVVDTTQVEIIKRSAVASKRSAHSDAVTGPGGPRPAPRREGALKR